MISIEEYGDFETSWCPGCGNFSILKSLKEALSELDIQPYELLVSSGIGQAAKLPHYMHCNMFNGLHGRSLPVAQGMKMANPKMKVLCVSGDGCSYGEGGNHFMAAIRRNLDITLLVHNNQIYGLTKGQASPTTARGHVTKAQPGGSKSEGFNPVSTAVAMKAGFVARAFSGEPEHLVTMIKEAMGHKGFSLVDILQPCVSFNKLNTFAWYKERSYFLEDHDPMNWEAAMVRSDEFGERIPLGVLYRNDRPVFETGNRLADHEYAKNDLKAVLQSYT
ncbi:MULTISPECIES: 2-oxoacid:ferredoxin oxidoreductase subunit beta [unclassified Pseudodesulfovibrio]|uniref:2-oxoacid:ferredoxin oxidoreductase subunit beta n=1 Tax=unclassified Pseudodesulfovibrio TaxID=2661612 RepID=UPI000FEB97E8|nr:MULTISPECIES: 2-oxoacid:ferredoxin oxidoreductase subunit beta [unclassified Pseudodesulfovibrio]MCJ2163939.1 2-oxoacid:ferredoxin oxidoreductase subunit beta [Pseudodesulfovibrio sp. S3-i]RWU05816.1 2-oxoacid:ferredoxin oxidoreductase subunit beta [Pseudodesulfovibrio sp. S3]